MAEDTKKPAPKKAGIKKAAADKHPDRYQKLVDTGMMVFKDPAYRKAVVAGKGSWEMITPGGAEACRNYVDNITAIGEEYRDLLKG